MFLGAASLLVAFLNIIHYAIYNRLRLRDVSVHTNDHRAGLQFLLDNYRNQILPISTPPRHHEAAHPGRAKWSYMILRFTPHIGINVGSCSILNEDPKSSVSWINQISSHTLFLFLVWRGLSTKNYLPRGHLRALHFYARTKSHSEQFNQCQPAAPTFDIASFKNSNWVVPLEFSLRKDIQPWDLRIWMIVDFMIKSPKA